MCTPFWHWTTDRYINLLRQQIALNVFANSSPWHRIYSQRENHSSASDVWKRDTKISIDRSLINPATEQWGTPALWSSGPPGFLSSPTHATTNLLTGLTSLIEHWDFSVSQKLRARCRPVRNSHEPDDVSQWSWKLAPTIELIILILIANVHLHYIIICRYVK